MGFLDRLPPRPAVRQVAFWVTGVLFTRALLLTAYLVLGDRQRGRTGTIGLRLTDEITGAATALPLLALVAWGAARWPLTRRSWQRHLWPLLALFVAFSVSHTLAMETARWVLYPLVGAVRDFGTHALTLAIWHEMPMDLFNFATFVAAAALWRFWWDATERERRAADTRRALADAQLSTLRLQLQPHFLFNALNTVSSTMYTDPRRADAILVELSELLRASLQPNRGDEVSLEQEIALTERYVRLQHERFGDRLSVGFDVDPACAAARVPVFVLQPLVENAIRYGGVERSGKGLVRVTARRDQDVLALDVWNDDDGAPAIPGGTGLGLRSIGERLALLHGKRATFWAGPEPGGWRVRMTLPFREGP